MWLSLSVCDIQGKLLYSNFTLHSVDIINNDLLSCTAFLYVPPPTCTAFLYIPLHPRWSFRGGGQKKGVLGGKLISACLSFCPSISIPRFWLNKLYNFFPNLHCTLTIRQCMFSRKKGAQGQVLQEFCHFMMFAIWLIVHTPKACSVSF